MGLGNFRDRKIFTAHGQVFGYVGYAV
uniref:Putative Ribonucleoside-diphosphate reductase (Ribonucleoside diphosphate reductase, alpha subunit) (Ribonucleotide reductase large subunit) n=1 Tax=mine drainage metagenome TaxID=410659 RepID=E6QSP5_9ZZZZ